MRICLLLHRMTGMSISEARDLPLIEAEEWLAEASRLERDINKQAKTRGR